MTVLAPAEIARRITGILEVDANLALGALSAKGRGNRGMIFQRYLAAYIMVDRFDIQVEHAAALLHRDRGTVTKALKVFKFLEGYQGWRKALDTVTDLSERFLAYAEERTSAQVQIPAPVGRDKRNDTLPAWVRERYAVEMEAHGDIEIAGEARAAAEADSFYLRHPAVMAITDDLDLQRFIGDLVVSVTLSPLDDLRWRDRSLLLVPPTDSTTGAIALRLMMKGDSPPALKKLMEARAMIARILIKAGFRLSGATESFASREHEGWRYAPLHIYPLRAIT